MCIWAWHFWKSAWNLKLKPVKVQTSYNILFPLIFKIACVYVSMFYTNLSDTLIKNRFFNTKYSLCRTLVLVKVFQGIGRNTFSLDLCAQYILSKLGNSSQVCYIHHSYCTSPQVKSILWTLNVGHVKQMRGDEEVEGENKEHIDIQEVLFHVIHSLKNCLGQFKGCVWQTGLKQIFKISCRSKSLLANYPGQSPCCW